MNEFDMAPGVRKLVGGIPQSRNASIDAQVYTAHMTSNFPIVDIPRFDQHLSVSSTVQGNLIRGMICQLVFNSAYHTGPLATAALALTQSPFTSSKV